MTLTMTQPSMDNSDLLNGHNLQDDEIFYSDDESSDTENYWSKYFNNKKESIFSGSFMSARPDNCDSSPNTNTSDNNKQNSNFIDNPITQICSGIQNLLEDSIQSSAAQPSYSSIIKKEPLANKHNNINNVKVVTAKKPTSVVSSAAKKAASGKAKESALAAGYRFKAREAKADPRYPWDQQLMVGPIPGQLEHDVIYHNLRSIFQARGPVCFMFVHKSAVKDLVTGKPVKFGYVIFAEKGIAQKLIKEGGIEFGGGEKISVRAMKKE